MERTVWSDKEEREKFMEEKLQAERTYNSNSKICGSDLLMYSH